MKKLLLCISALVLLFQGTTTAQLVDVINEAVAVPTLAPGSTAYRIYARLQDPTDRVSAVFGSTTPSPIHHLLLGSTNAGPAIFNHQFGDDTGDAVNCGLWGFFADAKWDSYVTFNHTNSTNAAAPPCTQDCVGFNSTLFTISTPPGMIGGSFNFTAGPLFSLQPDLTLVDGAWFTPNDGSCGASPTGADNRVLIAQVTVPTGTLFYQLNISVFDESLGALQMIYVHTQQDAPGLVGSIPEIDGQCLGLVFPTPPACLLVPGCMDPTACNYDPLATSDDGSCTYPGCDDPTACNYDILAGCNDGSCTYPGCDDPTACNYDNTAGCSDGSCTYPGCNDNTACNYDAAAGCDDGSCCYGTCAYLTVTAGSFASEIGWSFGALSGGAPVTDVAVCVDGCTNAFDMTDSFGDGWNGATFTFNDAPGGAGNVLATGTLGSGQSAGTANVGELACGCTDPLACNYDATATVDDGSCFIAPANDECAGAVSVAGDNSYAEDNTNSCIDGPQPTCGLGLGADVWYSFTWNGGTLTIDTDLGSLTDTRLTVYDACGGAVVGCNDDDPLAGDFSSSLDFACPTLNVGTTYYVQASGYNGLRGTFTINFNFDDILGCTDPLAVNYDACATVDDGTCSYVGCTDPLACNWDPGANTDDGSCCLDNCVTITVTSGSFASEVSWTLTDALNNVVASGGAPFSGEFCLPTGCYNLNESDSFGDGWNGAVFTASDTNGNSSSGTLESGSGGIDVIAIGGSGGCMDPGACNYNAAAICDDGSCEYTSCLGCTDPLACNYDDAATINDGSCCYDNCVSIDMTDSFGDGWNGATYSITEVTTLANYSGTLAGSAGTDSYCLPDGCYTISVGGGTFDSEVGWTLNGADGGSFGGGAPSGTIQFSLGGVDCYGCTDPTACNYDATTPFDDGSCILPDGCTDPGACNYNAGALCDDGSCIYPDGCTDPLACNYNAGALCDDGSCDYSCFGCTDPLACNFDAGATIDDGSCTYPPCIPNDVPAGAVALAVTPLGICSPLTDNLLGASDSPESMVVGPDLWYSFTAVTSGIRIEANEVLQQDLAIELFDAGMNSIDFANDNIFPIFGDEALNIGNLIAGNQYFISIGNCDVPQGIGMFDICVQWLPDSRCDYGPGPYTLCQTFKADWVGAAAYTFYYESTTTLLTYSKYQASPTPGTFCVLNTVPNLGWNDSYTVTISAHWNLSTGAGMEMVEVLGDEPCPISISAAPLMVLRPSDNCANFGPHFLGQYIAGQPSVCGVSDYEWTFTRTDVPELPIVHLRGAPNRFLQLSAVPGLTPGGSYDVMVRPIFANGAPSSYGATDCVSIVGPGGMILDGTQASNQADAVRATVAEGFDAAMYPNPNNGELVNINLTDIDSDIAIVEIVDVYGKLVFSKQYTVDGALNTMINFEQPLAGGVYMVNISLNDEVRTMRLVVER